MSKPAVQIRPASPMDSVNIVRLIREGYEQTPAQQVGELDEQKLLEYVTVTLRHAFVVVADQDKSRRVLGTLALAPIRLPWCNSVVMAETWFAVTVAYRTRGVPEQLLESSEAFLDKNRAVGFLGSQILTPADIDASVAKRHGYTPSRQTFLRLPHRQANEKGQPAMPRKAVSA